jgi:hypothetical protein
VSADLLPRNAVIDGTMLGVEDHGILTAFVYLDYGDGIHQGFGGYALDEYDRERKRRKGTAFGAEFIRDLLDAVGVSQWEKLKGVNVRVRADHGKVYAIGHIIKDQWFDPGELAARHRSEAA